MRPLSELARVSGIKGDSPQVLAAGFIERIREMNREMGIPEKLDQIRREDMDQMAKWAVKEASPLYPVPVIYRTDDVKHILSRISGGGDQ